MAQVRKLQEGNIINKVPATKYFNVGDVLYDLNKFLNLIWHNFDPWIESNEYNDKVKNGARNFINLFLNLLSTGVAKINPDLTIMIDDPNGEWDNRVGFNKKGPKIFHFLTDDKIDDNRGIPHIAMNYILTILKSPYMIKKSLTSGISSLTDPVIKNIIKLDFGNNSTKFANSDFGFLSHQLYDRIGMFKKALKNYRDTTDFSIYDLDSQKTIKDNIDNAINLINNTSDYNEDFFKKISSYGFYGLEKYLGKSQELLQKEEFDKNLLSEVERTLNNLEMYVNKTLGNSNGTTNNLNIPQLTSVRRYSKNDYLQYAAPEITRALDYYFSILPLNWRQVTDWKGNNKLSFWTASVTNEPLHDISTDVYKSLLDDAMRENKISEAEANNLGKAMSRQLTRFLLGRSTKNFNTSNKKALEYNVKAVMSMANYRKNFTPIAKGFVILPDSYDRETRAYTAINLRNNTLFAIPEIFVNLNIWDQITTKINQEMQRSKTGKYISYSTKDIMNASLKLFLRNVSFGTGTSVFNDILNSKLPGYKKGGILKALSGAELTLQILNDTTGFYSDSIKELNQQYNAYGESSEADRIRATANLERLRREARRKQVLDVREATKDAERERRKLDFLDNESLVITSWKDLANNLTTHDKLVVGTLLADVVALGGSLSGGAFNPVTDTAVLLSTLGTIGTIYTDDSLSPLAKIGYGAAGVGLNLLGLVPEVGAAAGMYKLTNTARKALPIISKVVRYGSMGLTGVNALGPLTKLASGEQLTKGDWKSLAYFAEALILGKISAKGVKEFKRYTKPVKSETKYTVPTKSGGRIQVSEDVYGKLNGSNIKTLKENYGKPENALKDIHGNDINIENLSTRGVVSKVKGNGIVKGKIDHINEGVRLKSLEEMHSEFGVPKITIKGHTTYQVPKSYLNLAKRLGQLPVRVVDETGAEAIVAEGTPKPAELQVNKLNALHLEQAPSELPPKSNPLADSLLNNEKLVNNEATTGKINNENGTAPKKLDGVQDNTKDSKLKTDKEKLEQKLEDASKKLTKINDDVKDFVKFLITSRYKKDSGVSYTTRRNLAALMKEVLEFKNATKGKLPSKYIKPGTTYYVRENGTYAKQNSINPLKVGNKTFKSKAERDSYYKHIFKFAAGGTFDFKKELERYVEGTPQTKSDKFISFGKKLLDSPDLWYGAAALNSKRFYDYQRRKLAKELWTAEEIPNTIIYRPSDYYNAKYETYKNIGTNNTLASRAGTSSIGDYLALKYDTGIVTNSSLLDKTNSAIATQKDADIKALDAKLENLYNNLRASAYNNSKAFNSWFNNLLNYDVLHEQNISGLRQQWLNDKIADKVDLKRAGILHNMVLGQGMLKLSGPYAERMTELDNLLKALMDKYGNTNNWLQKVNAGDQTAIDDFKTYSDLFKLKTDLSKIKELYDEDYMYNISQGNIDVLPALKALLKKSKFSVSDVPELASTPIVPVSSRGGTLSYEQRMSLKELDALKEKLKFLYKIALENKKKENDDRKLRQKDFNEAQKLLNKKSTMLLKASLRI